MMQTLSLVKNETFQGVTTNFYKEDSVSNYFMTANQLCDCLQEKRATFDSWVNRNPYLKSDEFSVSCKLQGTDGKAYETRLFNEDGMYEVTFLSKTEKARKFRAWVRGILKSLRKGDMQLSSGDVSIVPEVLVNKIDQLIGYNKQSIQHLQSQQENILDCLANQADLLLDLEKRVGGMKSNNLKSIEVKSEPINELSKKDIVRSIVKPLGQKLQDHSLGYKSTYKKVYVAMNINWKYRLTRWNNSHENKALCKNDLVSVDKKLLELFRETVEKMLQN